MSVKTELAEKILQSPQARYIYESVSPVYGDSYTALWLMQVIGMQLDDFQTWSEEYLLQVTPLTATWTINYWEMEYNLLPPADWTLEKRQQQLLAKMLYHAPLPSYKLEQIAENIAGIAVEVKENTAKNTFQIAIKGYAGAGKLKQIKKNIHGIKPAHLIFQLFTLLEYFIKQQMRTESNLALNSDYFARQYLCRSYINGGWLLNGSTLLNGTCEKQQQLKGDKQLDGGRFLDGRNRDLTCLNGEKPLNGDAYLIGHEIDCSQREWSPAYLTVVGELKPQVAVTGERFFMTGCFKQDVKIMAELVLNGDYFSRNVRYRQLDGSRFLDGRYTLDGESQTLDTELYPASLTISSDMAKTVAIETFLIIEKDLYYLDGTGTLDGSKRLDAEVIEMNL